jgi:transposase
MANSRMFAMAAAVALRSDFASPDLRRLARRTQDAKQARRLVALATIYDGGSRSDAARIGDVGLQIIRDRVLRFNEAGPDGLIDRKAPGPEPRLNDDHRAALAAAIESGPIPAIHGVVRWRLVDLCQWLWEEFRVSMPAAIEIWFADEARIGQKNKITRRWPGAAHDQRRPLISGPLRPTSSVPSAQLRARVLRSSCHGAIPQR